jgi:hypothetical protein
MISDLPESFDGYGVLYSTCEVLPDNGGTTELLTQRKARGFETIDGGFDVFLFHLLKKNPRASARIVVHVKNRGDKPVTIKPMQVIKSEGIIGRVHEFESTLGKRVLGGDWDTLLPKVVIPPGKGRVVGFSKQFGNVPDGFDSSRNVNCFGYVRAILAEKGPCNLEVSVVAIPAGARWDIEAETAKWVGTGAKSTDEVPLDREPEGCALKRAVGVYPNFIWKSDPVVLDASALTTTGTAFPMALPEIQTHGCEAARQTQDLALRPGYTREDTIGNYMIEYDVRLTFTNPVTTAPVSVDVRFGKTGADVGLAYQAAFPDSAAENPFAGVPVESRWAGPKQDSLSVSFLKEPVVVKAGGQATVALRFLVCGNSSLPFDLMVKKAGEHGMADKSAAR